MLMLRQEGGEMKKFDAGQLVVTAGVNSLMETNEKFYKFVFDSFIRYFNCDWGNCDWDDCSLNDLAVEHNDRIHAIYIDEESGWKIWIITEWDRSHTTVLFPWEY